MNSAHIRRLIAAGIENFVFDPASIAVDQRAQKHRMGETAHFVLDGKQQQAGLRIDDVAEAVLVGVVLAADETALFQFAVGAGKIRDIDRNVMAVIIRKSLR